jgi:hypothetical protein
MKTRKFKFRKVTNSPYWRRYYRFVAAARKLAWLDHARGRLARFKECDREEYAKLPEVFVRIYLFRYTELSRGKP